MITIDGLTKSQVRMLDTMWAIDSYDDYTDWKSTLCWAQKQQCETLEYMIICAEIDNVDHVGSEVTQLLSGMMN